MATPNRNALSPVWGGVQLPPHDSEVFTYVGVTNNVATIIGYVGGVSGTAVGTLTFTYIAAGAADDDDVASLVLTLPTANG